MQKPLKQESLITRNTAIDRYRKRNAQKRMNSHMENIAGEVEKLGSVISSEIDAYLRRKEIVEIFNDFLQGLSASKIWHMIAFTPF